MDKGKGRLKLLALLYTEGGGHQDQVGGIFEGIKICRTAASLPLQVGQQRRSLTQSTPARSLPVHVSPMIRRKRSVCVSLERVMIDPLD